MTLARKTQEFLLEKGFNRRQIARISLGAAATLPFFHEFAQAQQTSPQASGMRRGGGRGFDPTATRISSNENPMGPCKEGLEAMAKVGPLAWRYTPQGENLQFEKLLASSEGVKPDYVTAYPGSGTPLANCVPAFSSPTRSWVMASPGYGSGASRSIGNKVVKVALRKDYSHDVQAMIKADPNAGAYYICNPNNPSGTMTSKADFDYILANKAKDAVLVIDEAYVHFAGPEFMSTEYVKQDKDVVVLRTFSKMYGMAGFRAGALYGRPDLLEKVAQFGRTANLAVPTMACAAASLRVTPTLMPERIAANKKIRDFTYEYLQKRGVGYIPSYSNFFMMSVKGMTGEQVGQAMAAKKIILAGNRWPEWPQHIRVTVGTMEEMTKFSAALEMVLNEGPLKTSA